MFIQGVLQIASSLDNLPSNSDYSNINTEINNDQLVSTRIGVEYNIGVNTNNRSINNNLYFVGKYLPKT
jgi:hypothetical protein